MRSFSWLTGSASLFVLGSTLMVGCASGGNSGGGAGILRAGLPPSAKVVAEGATQLTYTPEEPGQVYLYNVDQDRVIGRFYMRRGQRFAMDGISGRATLDGNEVRIGETKKNGNYQVYFVPGEVQ